MGENKLAKDKLRGVGHVFTVPEKFWHVENVPHETLLQSIALPEFADMQVLISESQIAQRVHELGVELSEAYRGRPLTVVGVLTGSLLFLADLMRKLDVPHQIGFLQASSYRAGIKAEELTVNGDYFPNIAGRDVLLIDDIFDTGRTLETLLQLLQQAGPKSLKSAVLLWKEGTQAVALRPDYVGFKIPNEFVIGYGLDYLQDYRHLPHIAILEQGDLG